MNIVAECGPCNGDLEYAFRCAEAIARIRPDTDIDLAMKVQWYRADTLATKDALRYDRTTNDTLYQHELFQHQLSYDDWAKVAVRCGELDLPFFPTVFDSEAIDIARELGIRTLKIASGDITYHDLIAAAAQASDHLIISTGASTIEEIDQAVEVVDQARGIKNLRLTLLACHLAYPTSEDNAELGRVMSLLMRYIPQNPSMDIGYSDHTTLIHYPASILATYGASMWEKHFTMTPGAGGDHDFAVNSNQLKQMVRMVWGAKTALGRGEVNPTASEMAAREGARRSLVAKVDIPRLTKLTKDMFVVLRPGTGVPPSMLPVITGTVPGVVQPAQRAMIDIPAGTIIEPRMIGLVGATLTVE